MAFLVAFFGSFWALLAQFFVFALPWILKNIIQLLGLSVVSYLGTSALVSILEDEIYNRLNDTQQAVYSIIVMAGIPDAIAMIMAAYAAAFALGSMQRFRIKPHNPGP